MISLIGIVASLVSMGINCLLPFLKGITKETFISAFKGKTTGVDASCWLHKGLTISVQRTGRYESYVDICNGYLDLLLRHGVKPIVIFDGFPLPAKDDERAERKRKREELLQKSKE